MVEAGKDLQSISAELERLFEATEDKQDPAFVKSVEETLLSYGKENLKDYKPYTHFSDLHYTRNLVHASEHFELMVLCWKRHHASRIHNHSQSHCWMLILEGVAMERLFSSEPLCLCSFPTQHVIDHGSDAVEYDGCPRLFLKKETVYKQGEVGYASDTIGLHSFGNICGMKAESIHYHCECNQKFAHVTNGSHGAHEEIGTTDENDVITLHLYAPPIRKVKIYEPEQHKVLIRTPGFFSINGKKTGKP